MARTRDDRPHRPLSGRTVLLCLVTFFGVIFLANGILVRAAISTFGGVETSSSYQAGLAFARESAAVRVQDERHWQVSAKVRPASGQTLVDVDARDSAGRPLAGLQASASLAHPTDSRDDQKVVLSEDATGHFRGTTTRVVGQWDVIIELSRDGERLFRSRNRIVLN